jgi:Putative amidoligase enzyme
VTWPALLHSRIGFEVELLAPAGVTREDLAQVLAAAAGGVVRRVFQADSEPSLVPGMGHFLTLGTGFEVDGPEGELRCRLVDDLTIRAGLDPRARSSAGWYRILSDDHRMLRLVHRVADPEAGLGDVLSPLADLFGTRPQHLSGAVRVNDEGGATVAIAAPLAGERERPCEVITPPVTQHHQQRLDELLAPARELGFTVPAEAAVHLHFDGARFRSVAAFRSLVSLFARRREELWTALGTNPRCSRLSPLPERLVRLVEDPATQNWSWQRLAQEAATTGLTKFFDINLTALLHPAPVRDTVEVRILPGSIDAGEITARAVLVERLLDRCASGLPLPGPRVPLAAVLEHAA